MKSRSEPGLPARKLLAARDMAMEDLPVDMDGLSRRQRLRQVLGSFATGVTIVTTTSKDGRHLGLTVNSFSSLSLDPPLILWSLAKSSANLAHFLLAPLFAVHVLNAEQAGLALRFSRPAEDRFDGLAVRVEQGVPLLSGCAAVLLCQAERTVDAGDHHLFIGRVRSLSAAEAANPPLVFYRGQMTSLVPAASP